MFFRSTLTQISFLLRRKGALAAFYILLFMVLSNFIGNVLAFQGLDVIQMYHPMKILLLSYNRINYNADMTILLTQLFPILVTCPAGFALAKEYQLGTDVMIVSRLGQRRYRMSKLLAAFVTTFVVFTVPFMLEIFLNCISFPLNAAGDLTNWGYYDSAYRTAVGNYYMWRLFVRAPYLYAVAGTLLFGFAAGIFGAFTMALSSLIKIKYNAFLFLPVFALLNLSVILSVGNPANMVSLRWDENLLLFSEVPKHGWIMATVLFVMAASSVGMVWKSGGKDCL